MKGCYGHKNNGDIVGKRDKNFILNNIMYSNIWQSKINNNLDILDIGSGSGRLNEFLKLYANTITNIEPFIIPFKQFLYDNVTWHTKLFENFIKENTKTFDLITFFFSFYLMENKNFVLDKCNRILNKNGIIFITENITDVTKIERYGYYDLSLLEDFCKNNNYKYTIDYTSQEPKSTICILENTNG